MRPRPRDTSQDADLLTDFCALLIDALQVAEIRQALLDITRTATPPPTPPARSVTARGTRGRRGH